MPRTPARRGPPVATLLRDLYLGIVGKAAKNEQHPWPRRETRGALAKRPAETRCGDPMGTPGRFVPLLLKVKLPAILFLTAGG